MQFTGEHCGLCTRSITGRNRDEVTIINSEGIEEVRRVCTYCFAIFNYLTGGERDNDFVQEGFSGLMGAVMRTRNANVRKGKIIDEYDENDVATPARRYVLMPVETISPAKHDNNVHVPDWMPKEELELLQSLPSLAMREAQTVNDASIAVETEADRVAKRRAELEARFGPALDETPLTFDSSKPYEPVALQAGNFVECGACENEARPGKQFCEGCKEHEKS